MASTADSVRDSLAGSAAEPSRGAAAFERDRQRWLQPPVDGAVSSSAEAESTLSKRPAEEGVRAKGRWRRGWRRFLALLRLEWLRRRRPRRDARETDAGDELTGNSACSWRLLHSGNSASWADTSSSGASSPVRRRRSPDRKRALLLRTEIEEMTRVGGDGYQFSHPVPLPFLVAVLSESGDFSIGQRSATDSRSGTRRYLW